MSDSLFEGLGREVAALLAPFAVVAEDPAALTRMIFGALHRAGARGVVSRGWAHLGGEAPPPNVYLIDDCPHDWLFPRCRAVCHHGGAGTTSTGLRAGLPTVVVPFFGDQFFWGRVIADAEAGPEPIPIQRLNSDALAAAHIHPVTAAGVTARIKNLHIHESKLHDGRREPPSQLQPVTAPSAAL